MIGQFMRWASAARPSAQNKPVLAMSDAELQTRGLDRRALVRCYIIGLS